jgi:quercetin dioxygenase-like cupin family protein
VFKLRPARRELPPRRELDIVIRVSIEKGPFAVQTGLFGGRGDVRVWSLLDGEAGPFTAVLSCELSPGGTVGPHVQQEFPEIVIGVEGHGEATVDGHLHALRAGDAVYLPLGSVLTIENRAADTALRYLIIKARQ